LHAKLDVLLYSGKKKKIESNRKKIDKNLQDDNLQIVPENVTVFEIIENCLKARNIA